MMKCPKIRRRRIYTVATQYLPHVGRPPVTHQKKTNQKGKLHHLRPRHIIPQVHAHSIVERANGHLIVEFLGLHEYEVRPN